MRSGGVSGLIFRDAGEVSGVLMIAASSVAIIHVLQAGIPWRAAPSAYGPGRTLCNRFRRWAEKGIRKAMFASLADEEFAERVVIDGTIVRAHPSARGGKGGRGNNASDGRAAAPRPGSIS